MIYLLIAVLSVSLVLISGRYKPMEQEDLMRELMAASQIGRHRKENIDDHWHVENVIKRVLEIEEAIA